MKDMISLELESLLDMNERMASNGKFSFEYGWW